MKILRIYWGVLFSSGLLYVSFKHQKNHHRYTIYSYLWRYEMLREIQEIALQTHFPFKLYSYINNITHHPTYYLTPFSKIDAVN